MRELGGVKRGNPHLFHVFLFRLSSYHQCVPHVPLLCLIILFDEIKLNDLYILYILPIHPLVLLLIEYFLLLITISYFYIIIIIVIKYYI